MADNDFVRRSMQIVGRGFVQSTTNYFDNAISFVNDTKEIIDMGVDTAKNAYTKYNDMRTTGVGKKFRDWFYNEGGMFGDFDFGDDDFDAGFDIDSADDVAKESAQPLTSDQLESVSKKQTGAIYKALGKNADLHMANTAEIVSAINGRSAELTASVNNINNTLVQIGKRLDLIVEYTAGRMKKPGYESSTEKSLFDYNGHISVSSLKDVIKEAMEDSLTGSLLSTASNLKEFITPESISQMVFSGLFEKITFRSGPLKGKSVNDVGEFINESIGQAITDGFTKLLTSKNELLSTLFSDIISDRSSVNFQKYATNQYNDKPAVFDGMTRKSIITVIPGYLNEILKAVNNGKGMSVDNKGNLSDKEVNYFVKNVSENMFGSVSVNRDVRESTYQFTKQAFGKNVSRELMIKVYEAIQASWLFWMYRTGTKILEIGQVTDLSRESTLEVVGNAVEVLSIDPEVKVSPAELTSIVRYVLTTMDEKQFRNNLNARYKSFKNGMIESTQNSVHGYQAGKITKDVWLKGAQMYNDKYKDTPTVQSSINNQIGSSSASTMLSTNDYLHGIYSILNRGVNVYVTGSSSKGRKSAYKKFDIRPGISHTSTIISPIAETNVDASSAPSQTMPQLPQNIAGDSFEAIDAQRYATLIANEGDLSPQDQKELAQLKKEIPSSKRAAISKWLRDHRTLKGSTVGINPLVDVIQNNAPGLYANLKNSKIGTFGSRVFNAGKNAYNRASQAIFGREVVDANGEVVYDGGAINAASNTVTNVANTAVDFGMAHMPTSMLQRRADNLFNSVASRNATEMTHDQIEDQQLMQLIQQEMPLVMSNGAVDEEELNALMTNVRSIKDPELKRQINRTLIPLLRRNKVKAGDVNTKGEGGGAKTTLGKILSMGLGVLGMIFKPVLTYIKYVGGALLLSFKKISGKILKVVTWGIRTGAQQIFYGAKSFAQGSVSMIKLGMKAFKPKIDKLYEGFRGIKRWFGEIKTKLSNWLEKTAKGLGNFGKSLGSFFGFSKDGTTGTGNGATNENFFTTMMKKFRNSDFGAGFLKAHDDRKKIKANDLLSATPETKTDAELNRANTTLTSILSTIQAIGEKNGIKFGNKNADGTVNPASQLTNGVVNAAAGVGGNSTPQMDDVKAPQTSGNAQMADVSTVQNTSGDLGGQSTVNPAATANVVQQGAKVAGGAAGALGATVAGAVGLMSGGIGAMIVGILKFVMSIVSTLKSFKALLTIYKNLLQTAFKPLNSLFKYVMKEFKPAYKAFGKTLKALTAIVTSLLTGIIQMITPLVEDVMKPLYEALGPALETIVGILEPIFAVLGAIMKVALIPMMAQLKFVVIPVINIIADVLSYIAGAIMVGVGTVEGILGGIFQGIGTLISLVGKFTGGSIKEYGAQLIDDGKELADSGNKYIAEGVKLAQESTKKLIADTISFATLGTVHADIGLDDDKAKKGKTIESAPTDQIANTYANGDVSNTWIYNNGSSDIYNTYGGEYQRGMGGYLNMNQRGCGPIALADMYNRRGGHMSARDLASSMYGAGAYDPTRGTSIGSYLSAGRALGMGLHAGTVTQDSLKLASPSNPITVIGSGSDYGTRSGNNHYMNVIGADRHGGAYVSNPLTGRVERKPASTIAGSSVVGIYGSGDYDDDDEGYTFPDAIKEAFSELKAQAAKILGLFTMDDEDDYETQISNEKNAAAEEQAKRALGDKYDAFAAAAEELARADYRDRYPQRDGQSDDDYEAAFQKWYKNKTSEYLAKAKVDDMTAGETASEIYNSLDSANSDLKSDLEKFIKNTYSNMSSVNNSIYSSSGGRGNVNNIYEAAAQVWEAMADKAGGSLYSYDDYGPITTRSGITLPEIHPDCSGMLSATMNYMGYDFRNTMNGSNRRWTTHDISGKTSNDLIYKDGQLTDDWTFIPYSASELKEGDILTTPEHVGLYVSGSSQNAKGFDAGNGDRLIPLGLAAKAYLDGDPDWKSKLQWTMGPGYPGLTTILRYTKPMAGQGRVELSGQLSDYSGWGPYATRAGVPTFINAGKAAGMTAAEIATLMSTGIWEDSGAKIFGLKSLNDTTYDYNGQAAKGIMNWVDQDVNYGNTVLDQLKWIHNTYFDEGSTDWRAKVRDNGFMSQDTQAFKEATGRSGFKLNIGDRYGPYANQDIVEGSAFFFMDALVPEKIHTTKGMAENVGTAADAYNWMLDNGYIDYDESNPTIISPTGSGSVSTGYGMVNSSGDAQIVSNIAQIGTRDGKNTGIVNTNDTGLALKEKPDLGSKFLIEIPKGTRLNLEASGSKEWFKTSYAGKTGYVYASYIKLDRNDLTNEYKGLQTSYTPSTSNKTTSRTSVSVEKDWSAPTSYDDILPKNDASWKAKWYTDPSYYKYFMSQDNRGNWSPMYTSGRFKTLENMSRLIAKNVGKSSDKDKNIYWQNLKNATGDASRADWLTQQIYDTAFTAEEWKNLRDNYTKNPKTDGAFQDALDYVHMGMYGSGDMSESDFWNDYLGWNGKTSSSTYTPIPDSTFASDLVEDATGNRSYNVYNITRGDGYAEKEAFLKTLFAHTFDVRSDSMEALLQEILVEVKRRNKGRGTSGSTNGSTKLFDEQIPSQVSRLSIG